MMLTHLVLTRFSYRDTPSRPGRVTIRWNGSLNDPLALRRLAKRFLLFELLCLPSVLAQTTRDFTWILLIDPELKKRERDRLRELTAPHARTHLAEVSSVEDLGYLRWLQPYVHPGSTHIATTNIDDDDLIGRHLLSDTQRCLREREAAGTLPSCLIIGCSKPPYWDFAATRRAPLGYVKPWHGPDFPTFTGYTVCCKRPEYDFSVLAFDHAWTKSYFDPTSTLSGTMQQALRKTAEHAGEDWRQWRAEDHLHILTSTHPQVVVVNHTENDQFTRLFRRWSDRQPVMGPADFPEMSLDFDRVRSVIRKFRRSPLVLIGHIRRSIRLAMDAKWGPRERRHILHQTLMAPLWFLIGLPRGKRMR